MVLKFMKWFLEVSIWSSSILPYGVEFTSNNV